MKVASEDRPGHDGYFMGIAIAVRERANCKGNRIGAVLVRDDRIISTGYNGTPEDMENCLNGGCHRCSNRQEYESGTAYDLCICVHAEQNAILSAARFGIAVEGSTLYTTMRPCFGCTKELLQAKVKAVYYLHEWTHPNPKHNPEFVRIQARFPEGIRRLEIDDPQAIWAVSKRTPISAQPVDEHGTEEI